MTKLECTAAEAAYDAAQWNCAAIDGLDDVMECVRRIHNTFSALRKDPTLPGSTEYVVQWFT